MVYIEIPVSVFFSCGIKILWSILKFQCLFSSPMGLKYYGQYQNFSVCFLVLRDYDTMVNIEIPVCVFSQMGL